MKIIISGIPDEGLEQEGDVSVCISEGAAPVTAHVLFKVSRFQERVLVSGRIDASVILNCGRCLKDFAFPAGLDVSEEFIPVADVISDGERELGQDEMDISFYTGDELDITGMVKEEILLAVPMKPLCSEGCRGLCTVCGLNLNEGSCECRKEEVDPRLAPLAKYKELIKDRKE